MVPIVLLGLLLRVGVGLYGYSGLGKPPMFGDYEAQRHWMEITYHLPPIEWYFNTTDNDLMYWGLDYPPLTAYHSWLCGAAAQGVNPDWISLGASRGHESPGHKAFMRGTVLLADMVTYFLPAIVIMLTDNRIFGAPCPAPMTVTGYALITYPGLILIDHGHFQYNCVSLGLVLAACCALFYRRDVLAAVLFSLALNYKQMALYYALPIFMYLLNRCWCERERNGLPGVLLKFTKLAFAVSSTFLILWLPFITNDGSNVLQVLRRLFPLSRGIFEDKVANFWCVLNVFYKIRPHFSNEQTALISGIATLLAVLPSCCHLLVTADRRTLLYSLFNTSLAFFMFSFQVHEKTILFAALPALLLFEVEPFHSLWFLTVSSFSMLPLFIKDGLVIPFVALTVFFALSMSVIAETKNVDILERKRFHSSLTVAFKLSMNLIVFLTGASLLLEPPAKYPDLFPLVISAVSAGHFGYFLLYFYWSQFKSCRTKEKIS
ncbi:asparagine-linked glycosylation 6, alpha-1,3-glucosyltransferase homolog (S. cerevisiae) [Nesidiocoris tenuis]|uniref:Alpha-1,3-glucosyltransferase n=1 Tax=Nesidiocoris tenuis TaxID=355587 RepID=A0ABN7BE46_9HEMI|nr:asparagine-linked glycosylation 6, alpha-1,3-glucosyltransferase homolog (S. cerevisiae) [Nesidiocoris tenuis]